MHFVMHCKPSKSSQPFIVWLSEMSVFQTLLPAAMRYYSTHDFNAH